MDEEIIAQLIEENERLRKELAEENEITDILDERVKNLEYENEMLITNIESFMKITAKNFSILKDDDEIIDPDHQKVFLELKLKSLKFSKNLEKIQKQLKTNLSLLLQGHTSPVRCVAVTSDNKNVISSSYDNTIRIWNLLEKIQEAVLEGHTDSV